MKFRAIAALVIAGAALAPAGTAHAQGGGLGPAPSAPYPGWASTLHAAMAPLHTAAPGAALAGQYIVALRSGATMGAPLQRARSHGIGIKRQFGRALPGYLATLTAAQLNTVRQDPDVAYVEADQVVHASTTQSGAPWGLDRIDQRALPLSGTYSFNANGAGVTVFVIDTGIRATHTQFAGRVSGGTGVISDGHGTDDCAGHGTHVAGTVGGSTFGVAKAVRLVPVRVLDCAGAGSSATVIAGLDWVTANHSGPSVANLSLGGGASTAVDSAISRAVASGVTVVVAAGNETADACNSSPARAPAAITVGATTSADSRDTSYSNFGSCVDLFAPGTGILSSFNTSDTATATESGTSMATPHVAGAAAVYLQGHPGASPAQVQAALIAAATPNVVANAGTGSPNRLLFSDPASTPGGTTTTTRPAGTTTTSTTSSRTTTTTTSTSTSTTVPGCASSAQVFGGRLAATGSSAVEPNGTYYTAQTAGTHTGCLVGPSSGVDFDLYLYRWDGSAWQVVARSTGNTASENVSFSGPAGYYYWRIYAFSGTGSFQFALTRP